VLTASTSEAYSLLFKLLCDPGDDVLIPVPSYPLFDHLTALDGVGAIQYALHYDGRWWVDLDTLDRAWSAIDYSLERAIASDERILLLITGHERRGDRPLERGRIRAAVHDWLAVSRHASRIAAVRGAHRRHGRGGSLYIILRKS